MKDQLMNQCLVACRTVQIFVSIDTINMTTLCLMTPFFISKRALLRKFSRKLKLFLKPPLGSKILFWFQPVLIEKNNI